MREDQVEVVENPDGTATINIEVDRQLRETILRTYGKKRLTKKLVEEFVITAIQRHAEKNDETR